MSCPLEAAPDQNLRLEIEEAPEASTRRARALNVGYVGEMAHSCHGRPAPGQLRDSRAFRLLACLAVGCWLALGVLSW